MKLTREQVEEIRDHAERFAPRYGRKQLADKYGVNEEVIRDVVNYKTYLSK